MSLTHYLHGIRAVARGGQGGAMPPPRIPFAPPPTPIFET